MLSFLWDLASFIVALGVLITVHEFGHFWVARRCGVRVERFSIGFGKALWRRTDKLGTEYVIALIPLGGYVKMLDERAEPVVPELRHHAFNNKSVGQRAAIIAAGPVANFIFAIFAYWLVFIIGVPGVRPVVGEIAANSIVRLILTCLLFQLLEQSVQHLYGKHFPDVIVQMYIHTVSLACNQPVEKFGCLLRTILGLQYRSYCQQ